ncbi:hypothetical protein FB451DRAFT_1260431 [Mycena latifolia]|nr:hypothetical protein FB451DRAFT_1260431 [Mycena latifolia]
MISSVLVFMSATGRGLQIQYPSITLHAVSRADSGPSIYWIYCQLDETPDDADDILSDDNVNHMRELSIVPRSTASFLHPNKATASDDDLDDAFIDADSAGFEAFTGEGDQELSQAGRATLEHLASIISYPKNIKQPGLQ